MRLGVVLCGLGLFLASCSQREPEVRLSSDAGGEAAPGNMLLTCDGGLPFLASTISGPTGVEDGSSPAAEALRDILGTREDPGSPEVPTSGWRLLAEAPTEVLFGAGDPPHLITVTVRSEAGGWDATRWGGCRTRRARDGFEAAEWQPIGPVRRDERLLDVVVTERACASGQPPGERLQPAEVEDTADAVTITFWVATQTGDQDCPGNPPTKVTVTLDEPLGDRALRNGGDFPPTELGGPGDDPPVTTVTTGPTSTTVVPTGPPPADPAAAEAAIDAAFHTAFDAGIPDADRFDAVEDGPALLEAGKEAAAKFPQAAASITVTVHSIAFIDAMHAAVTFELLYEGAMLLGPQQGEAVSVEGGWKVSRGTRCAIIEQAGVTCP